MRLDQKFFVPFMLVVAVITMIVIVISSFSHNEKLNELFYESLAESDSLEFKPLKIFGREDTVSIQQFQGNTVVVAFWASWSERAINMLKEIEKVQTESADSLIVLAALVKDAEESLQGEKQFQDFMYVDGTQLFNDLKVPGYPSYLLFNKKSEFVNAQIGYRKGEVYDSLMVYLP